MPARDAAQGHGGGQPRRRVRRGGRLGGRARAGALPAPGRGGHRAARPAPTSCCPRRPGSGKSLVAVAAHAAALAQDQVTYYTAPIKALVSEKFFALCEIFGAEDVGMLTGDASVNADAPIICCTAEILANIALREGAERRRRARGDGRVPLLRRAGPRLGLAGAADRAAAGAVRADVGHPRRRHRARRGHLAPQRPGDRAGHGRRAAGAADLHLGAHAARRDARGAGASPTRRRSTSCTSPRRTPSSTPPRCSTPSSGIVVADELKERLAGFRFGAGFGKTLVQAAAPGDRRPPRRAAAALPAPGRAARPGRAAHRHLRHRHPRRRHQRADPDRAVHRAGQVRRQPAAGCCGSASSTRSPAAPAGPASTPPATSSSRRPSTRSRTRRPRPRRPPRTRR